MSGAADVDDQRCPSAHRKQLTAAASQGPSISAINFLIDRCKTHRNIIKTVLVYVGDVRLAIIVESLSHGLSLTRCSCNFCKEERKMPSPFSLFEKLAVDSTGEPEAVLAVPKRKRDLFSKLWIARAAYSTSMFPVSTHLARTSFPLLASLSLAEIAWFLLFLPPPNAVPFHAWLENASRSGHGRRGLVSLLLLWRKWTSLSSPERTATTAFHFGAIIKAAEKGHTELMLDLIREDLRARKFTRVLSKYPATNKESATYVRPFKPSPGLFSWSGIVRTFLKALEIAADKGHWETLTAVEDEFLSLKLSATCIGSELGPELLTYPPCSDVLIESIALHGRKDFLVRWLRREEERLRKNDLSKLKETDHTRGESVDVDLLDMLIFREDVSHDVEGRLGKLREVALMGAVTGGHFNLVRYLIEKERAPCYVSHLECAVEQTTPSTEASEPGSHPSVPHDRQLELVVYLFEHLETRWDSPVQVSRFFRLGDTACRSGNLEVVKYLYKKTSSKYYAWTPDSFKVAVQERHMDVVRFLYRKRGGILREWYWGTMGFLDNRGRLCTDEALDTACANGDLEMVKFLFETVGVKGSCNAFENACESGHLDVVKFLHENKTTDSKRPLIQGHSCIIRFPARLILAGKSNGNPYEGQKVFPWKVCTPFAVDLAARNGHLDVIDFLLENRKEGCTDYSKVHAGESGDLRVLQYFESRMPYDPIVDIFSIAARGHVHILRYIHERQPDVGWLRSAEALDEAAGNGHVEVVKFFCETRGLDPQPETVGMAAHLNRLNVLKYIFEELMPPSRRPTQCEEPFRYTWRWSRKSDKDDGGEVERPWHDRNYSSPYGLITVQTVQYLVSACGIEVFRQQYEEKNRAVCACFDARDVDLFEYLDSSGIIRAEDVTVHDALESVRSGDDECAEHLRRLLYIKNPAIFTTEVLFRAVSLSLWRFAEFLLQRFEDAAAETFSPPSRKESSGDLENDGLKDFKDLRVRLAVWAGENGQIRVFRMLSTRSPLTEDEGTSALSAALRANKLDAVRYLVEVAGFKVTEWMLKDPRERMVE
ncbi:hypothetical protein HDU96_009132 [Phlyctochytrium bullatum]|nr:hypothetical protein HDU96_009132 [Phlyctochytrium bullatum]